MAGIQSIRDGLDGVVVKFIVAFIIVAFVGSIGWSVFFSSSDANVVASVNDLELEVNDLTFEMQTQDYYLKQRFSDQDFEIEDEILMELSMESLLRKASILSYISETGSSITDNIAYKQLSTNESYQENGKFSIERFESISRSQGFIPTTYLKRIKQDIAMSFWRSGIADTSFVTETAIQNNLNLAEQTRDISYLRFNLSEFINSFSPSNDELMTFYDNNKNNYQTEETAKVSFIKLSTEDQKKKASVDQEAIQSEYNFYTENFDDSVRRSVSHIMINIDDSRNSDEANKLILEIKARLDKEDFKDLVTEFSDDAGTLSSGGDLGISNGSVFPPEFEEALLAMQVDQISNPIQLDESIHLLKLTDIQKPSPESFEERSESIQDDLLNDLANSQYAILIDQAMDLTFSFNDLESVAKELDLAQKETSYFSRSSSTGELDYKTVKDMIFGDQQIQEGSLSEVIEVSDGMAFIVQVSDFRPQALKSFIEVESEVTSALKLSLANTKLQSEVQESLNKSKEGVDLESIASSKELELVSYKALARNSSLLPNNVIAEVFGMPRSALSEGTAAAYFENGDSIVYRLDKVNESKSVISSEEKEGFKAYILSERGLAELSDLQDAAYKSATVVRKSTQPLQ